MVRADRKMHPYYLCYLELTVVVKPLNVIRVGMLSCGQAKLLDHLNVHQVVAATTINDGMYTTVLDDEEHVEEVVALSVVVVADRGTQSSLHNQGLIGLGRCCTKNLFITIISSRNVSSNSIFIFNIRSTNIPTITSTNVCLFAGAISLHMAKSLAAVALDVEGAACGRGGCNRFSRTCCCRVPVMPKVQCYVCYWWRKVWTSVRPKRMTPWLASMAVVA
jgi:hypothetical protein